MTRSVDLNADCGEGFGPWSMGDDAALMEVVTSINMACGFHAGDPEVMARTLALAGERGVAVGAHPGYADREGFGRRVIPMRPREIERMVAYQIGAAVGLAALSGARIGGGARTGGGGPRIGHVKAHGALANLAAGEREVADAVARATAAVDRSLVLLAIAGTELVAAGERAGLAVASEVFADRAYLPSGHLMPRGRPGAVIHDAGEAAARVLRMVEEGAIVAHDGRRVAASVESVCVHGDTKGAVALARRVRAALEGAGVRVAAFAPSAGRAEARG